MVPPATAHRTAQAPSKASSEDNWVICPRGGKCYSLLTNCSALTPFHVMFYTQARWCVVRSGAQCSGFTNL